ncbi:MAG: BlaI/MecI/CopY family transcriptional regulator [Lachnospiraceae bacterium]|nr:BlaI/MecI/CopY family transcriptional regulator [Lachnospiraceae bacterium]
MSKEDLTPSETEWLVMEKLWESAIPLTSAEIISRLEGDKKMSPKTVRVLLNRLGQKKIVDYTIDKKDSRVYHYFAVKSKEECLKEKSRHFAESYFKGSRTGAMAALVDSFDLDEGQMKELWDILKEKNKG